MVGELVCEVTAVGELVCEVTAVGELVCEVSAVGKYAGRPLKAGDAAQPRGCSARFVPAEFGPVWITAYTKLAILCTAPFGKPFPYTKSVILCTAIKIMMRTAKKGALILAV